MSYGEDDYSEYFEPSDADLIYKDAIEKLKEVMHDDIKNQIANLTSDKEHLQNENQIYRLHEREVDQREKGVAYRETNLEYDFYHKKFSEILKPFVEHIDCFCVQQDSCLIDKCDECDDDRYIIYTSDFGKQIKQRCSCYVYRANYKPMATRIESVDFYKNDHEDHYYKDPKKPKFIATPKYNVSSNDDDHYCSVYFQKLIDKFDVIDADNLEYRGIIFTTELECQKYCDCLNIMVNEKTK